MEAVIPTGSVNAVRSGTYLTWAKRLPDPHPALLS